MHVLLKLPVDAEASAHWLCVLDFKCYECQNLIICLWIPGKVCDQRSKQFLERRVATSAFKSAELSSTQQNNLGSVQNGLQSFSDNVSTNSMLSIMAQV